jgi:hypothetical protein
MEALWTGIWLTVEIIALLLRALIGTCGFRKMRENPLLAENLFMSQGKLCCLELVV